MEKKAAKYIPIYGIDALPEILSKIESGEITGSVLQDAKTQGQTIVKMAENLTSGKDAVDGIERCRNGRRSKSVYEFHIRQSPKIISDLGKVNL